MAIANELLVCIGAGTGVLEVLLNGVGEIKLSLDVALSSLSSASFLLAYE